jgi:hypothetical protein
MTYTTLAFSSSILLIGLGHTCPLMLDPRQEEH